MSVVAAGSCAARARSYRRSCGNVGNGTRKRLLATGVGRSGTLSLHLSLTAMGLRIGHDGRHKLLADGAVSWGASFAPGRVGDARCRAPFGWSFNGRFDALALLVRAPLAQVASRWDRGRRKGAVNRLMRCHTVAETPAWDTRHPALRIAVGEKKDRTMGHGERDSYNWLVDCLRHWVLVNAFVDATADATIRTEDLGAEAVLRLAALANLTRADGSRVTLSDAAAARATVTNANSAHTRKPEAGDDAVTWPALLRLDAPYAVLAQALAIGYGYDVSPRAPRAMVRAACLGDGPSIFDAAPPAWPGGVVPAGDARRARPLACFFEGDSELWACYLRCDGTFLGETKQAAPAKNATLTTAP